MNRALLSELESLTRDYAAFQARKSGLATALGGLMALLLTAIPMHLDFRWWWMQLILLAPLLWVVLRSLLARWLYRGLGEVKAIPDLRAERLRWRWVFGIAVFIVAFQALALMAFAASILGPPEPWRAALVPGPGLMVWPFLHLLAAPWAIRGAEEGRAYAVLVGLSAIWLWTMLIGRHLAWRPGPEHLPFSLGTVIGGLILALLVIAWGALALVRGWREHRQYLALLREVGQS